MENQDKTIITSVETVSSDKASYDIQISTAKAFPRDIIRAVNDSVAIATIDIETAKSCGYALPRGGKTIQGPSVHLARIIAQNWGNLRVEAKVKEITYKEVISEAICFDLQTNVAIKVEVRRKITNKQGQRFNEDMITVTGNAANSVALRNAVFNVVPRSIVDKVYKEAKNMMTGDISSEAQLIKRRNEALQHFKDKYSATEKEVLEVLGIGSMNAIRQDEIITLLGLAQAIEDGDTTANETFSRTVKKKTGDDKKKDLKDNAAKTETKLP